MNLILINTIYSSGKLTRDRVRLAIKDSGRLRRDGGGGSSGGGAGGRTGGSGRPTGKLSGAEGSSCAIAATAGPAMIAA